MPWLWENKVETNTTPNSQKVIDLKSLTFQELWDAYPRDKDAIDHRQDNLDDYCAINLSDALLTLGIKMKSFKGVRCWGTCTKNHKHAIRAQELATWLLKKPFPNCPKVQRYTGLNFQENLKEKTGIVFFKDYWLDRGVRTGDHIDLWNKNELANSGYVVSRARLLFPDATESVTSLLGSGSRITSLEKATEVLFWEIR